MGRKKKSADEDQMLTPLELEVMTILWQKGEGNVHEVLEALAGEKDYAYTTVSTVLRILLGKGVVSSRAHGRQHSYIPVLSKEEYEERTISHMVSTVFDGEPASLLRRLISTSGLSKKDLNEIQELIEKRGKK